VTSGGFSADRLGRMRNVMAGYVDRGLIPGLVYALRRRGETHVVVTGTKAAASGDAMRRDTIFRISSMSKPITAVAAMILVEECVIRLDEPVQRLLPELVDRRVLRRLDGPLGETVPANRPITVRDLLTFRAGFGLLMGAADAYPILRAAGNAGVAVGPPKMATPPEPDEWLRRFAELPLMHQPGESWMYGTGSSLLSILIARAAGQPFETFLSERVLSPLGMRDTGFSVPDDKSDRLATSYLVDHASTDLVPYDGVADSSWAQPPAFPDGGDGLVSTIDDYLAFAQMLRDNGRHGGGRILSRPSVALMTTDALTPEQKRHSGNWPGQWDSLGWGFGMSVTTRRHTVFGSPGRYGWDGGMGTLWSNDPAEDLIGVLMTQRAWESASPPQVHNDFWTSAYQAIDD
jgi:CubicO group peptidase (beta-lactamase class C family)